MVRPTLLFVYVEGPDDELFFSRIVAPKLSREYDKVVVRGYANQRPKQVVRTLKSLRASGYTVRFVADLEDAPCVTTRRRKLTRKYSGVKGPEIFIVTSRIESWYLAGLSKTDFKSLRIVPPSNFDRISKTEFEALYSGRYGARVDFLVEVLKQFSPSRARKNSASFDYFITKNGWSGLF